MHPSKSLFDRRLPELTNQIVSDIVYTPDWCAKDMIKYFNPEGEILEPCRGGGAFTRFLPEDTHWCEIREGKDFFKWDKSVDWIITNPPYSMTHEFLKHSMKCANNIVFLIVPHVFFASYARVRECSGWGGLAAIRWYGGGARLQFPMGNPIAAIHWKRNHFGIIKESFYDDDLLTKRKRLSGQGN